MEWRAKEKPSHEGSDLICDNNHIATPINIASDVIDSNVEVKSTSTLNNIKHNAIAAFGFLNIIRNSQT